MHKSTVGEANLSQSKQPPGEKGRSGRGEVAEGGRWRGRRESACTGGDGVGGEASGGGGGVGGEGNGQE